MYFITKIRNIDFSPTRKRHSPVQPRSKCVEVLREDSHPSLDAPDKVHTTNTLAWCELVNGRLCLPSTRRRKLILIVSALLLILLFLHYPSSESQSINLFANNGETKHFWSGGSLSESLAGVISVIDKLERNNTVVLTITNPAFDLLLKNWYCFAKSLIGRQFLVYTTDYDFGRRLSDKEGYHVLVQKSALNEALDFGTMRYQQLMLARTKVAAQLLEAGKSVLIVDSDALWLSDPFPYLLAIDADIVTARDGNTETEDAICGGFLYLKHSPTTKRIWSEVTRRHQDIIDTAMVNNRLVSFGESEQMVINNIFQAERLNVSAVTEKGLQPLRVHFLDPLLFPNGLVYFKHNRSQEEHVQPVVIHNNWIVGYAAKRKRFEEFGLWAVAAEDNEELADAGGGYRCSQIARG